MERARRVGLVVLVVAGIAVAGLAIDEATSLPADRARVTVVDGAGNRLGSVRARIADTAVERYRGLSGTESLGANEGMLFVHGSEGEYAYVMRGMSFPIDIVFIDANGTITAIHHAEVEEPPLTEYRGRGKYVLEVPYRWTTRHGVSVGDGVRIRWGG